MLTLYKPEREDLRFRQALLADEVTMAYNRAWGGTIPFPKEDWEDWHRRWVRDCADGRFYRYLQDENGAFIGEIAYHFDGESGNCLANVIVHAQHRGKGYGGEALELLCAAAKENGIAVLWDDIADDNPAVRLFLNHGFTEEYRADGKIYLKRTL